MIKQRKRIILHRLQVSWSKGIWLTDIWSTLTHHANRLVDTASTVSTKDCVAQLNGEMSVGQIYLVKCLSNKYSRLIVVGEMFFDQKTWTRQEVLTLFLYFDDLRSVDTCDFQVRFVCFAENYNFYRSDTHFKYFFFAYESIELMYNSIKSCYNGLLWLKNIHQSECLMNLTAFIWSFQTLVCLTFPMPQQSA